MAEGLEKGLTQRDIADLLAFLDGIDPPPKAFQDNHPRLVKPGPDGTISLTPPSRDLRRPPDLRKGSQQSWLLDGRQRSSRRRFEVAAPGKYAVWLDWAWQRRGRKPARDPPGQSADRASGRRHRDLGQLLMEQDRRAGPAGEDEPA